MIFVLKMNVNARIR